MDERQSKIKEGAGLEESRINQDFIDLLRKWSTPVLLILAIVAFAYVGYQRLERSRIANVNDAFQLLENTVSADSLAQVADDYSDVRAVPHMARLRQADQYLDAVRGRYRLLAELNPDGSLASEEDVLTDEDRSAYLRQARSIYKRVADDTAGNKAQLVLHVSALFGLAAVAESEGDAESARGHYQRVVDVSEGTAFDSYAELAKVRIDSLERIDQEVKIYAAADLPAASTAPETPVTPELPSGLPGEEGPSAPIEFGPIGPTGEGSGGGDPGLGDPGLGDPGSGDPGTGSEEDPGNPPPGDPPPPGV
jgi:tetratricopeptide (TPR) repeat protein